MSNATWGDPEPRSDETYPLPQLKHLLQQMMTHFAAAGACLALLDESSGQMVVRLHLRLRNPAAVAAHNTPPSPRRGLLGRRVTVELTPTRSLTGPLKPPVQLPEKPDFISLQNGGLFPLGASYGLGQDLIGLTWRENELHFMSQEEYIASFPASYPESIAADSIPACFLAAPIEASPSPDETPGRRLSSVIGIVVLYQTAGGAGFQQKPRYDVTGFTERMALYIQNHQLRRLQARTLVYIESLQQISTAFPTNVALTTLVEGVYDFVRGLVDVSSLLLTLYDRDTERIYDIFAVANGRRIEGLPGPSADPQERPTWWRVAQEQKHTLLVEDPQPEDIAQYEELLTGAWGDQRNARTFLLLPMKMFTRVIGSLALTSMQPRAYNPIEILVLETMVQIITVSIENARLYDRARQSLRESKDRQQSLAVMNSALQTVSTVLNVGELLHKLVEFSAQLVNAELCTFFLLSPDGEELIAQAIYGPKSQWQDWNTPPTSDDDNPAMHDDLIKMIRLPFKNSILESLVTESFFYLDQNAIEDLAQVSGEGGVILLRETGIKRMLMIPVRFQQQLVGILAVHTLGQDRVFKPGEVGVLLAVCAQAGNAIRNAQLFEEIQAANAELQRMDKLKDEFIVTASHELRTPLSAIKGYATLLQRQYARTTPQQVLRFATKISGATQQLSDLVVNMTEAAQLGTLDKKLDLQIGPVELFTAADVARDMLTTGIEQQIIITVPPHLWLECDPLRLRQVIMNLLDNAAKYSPPEGRILLEAHATTLGQLALPEDQVDHAALAEHGPDFPVVLVRVHDQGDGIAPEDQQKIFDKFVRASRSLTTPVRGSGLGLYICRQYTEAMGGRLWLERSLPGEGSTFSFYLPRINPPLETGEQHESR